MDDDGDVDEDGEGHPSDVFHEGDTGLLRNRDESPDAERHEEDHCGNQAGIVGAEDDTADDVDDGVDHRQVDGDQSEAEVDEAG
jgi:hypothetical protein